MAWVLNLQLSLFCSVIHELDSVLGTQEGA